VYFLVSGIPKRDHRRFRFPWVEFLCSVEEDLRDAMEILILRRETSTLGLLPVLDRSSHLAGLRQEMRLVPGLVKHLEDALHVLALEHDGTAEHDPSQDGPAFGVPCGERRSLLEEAWKLLSGDALHVLLSLSLEGLAIAGEESLDHEAPAIPIFVDRPEVSSALLDQPATGGLEEPGKVAQGCHPEPMRAGAALGSHHEELSVGRPEPAIGPLHEDHAIVTGDVSLP